MTDISKLQCGYQIKRDTAHGVKHGDKIQDGNLSHVVVLYLAYFMQEEVYRGHIVHKAGDFHDVICDRCAVNIDPLVYFLAPVGTLEKIEKLAGGKQAAPVQKAPAAQKRAVDPAKAKAVGEFEKVVSGGRGFMVRKDGDKELCSLPDCAHPDLNHAVVQDGKKRLVCGSHTEAGIKVAIGRRTWAKPLTIADADAKIAAITAEREANRKPKSDPKPDPAPAQTNGDVPGDGGSFKPFAVLAGGKNGAAADETKDNAGQAAG